MLINIIGFIQFVYRHYKNDTVINSEKLYQVKLLIEEYRFQIIADELLRINRFDWDEKYTSFLVDNFKKGIYVIDEYVKNNLDELFLLSARLHTLKNLSLIINKTERR